jgi:hypothetical protein
VREDEVPAPTDRPRFAAIWRLADDDRVLVPLAFALACLAVVSRRPDAVTHAQFFAEDGASWFAQAHDLGGARVLFVPYRSYLHLVPRLTGWLATVAPLEHAPLVMNAVAIAVEALPASFLCSRRAAAALPSLWLRLAIAVLYVGLPNVWGTISNVTNSQWHLAVLAALVVLSTPATGRAWRVFDVAVLGASGLSGPFALLLLPIIVITWAVRRERWLLTLGSVTAVAAVVQTGVLLFAPEQDGVRPPLGASVDALLRVVVGRVVYAGMLGQTGYERIARTEGSPWMAPVALGLAALALFAVVAYALARAPLELRLFVVYAILVLGAALAFPPVTAMEQPFWQTIADPAASNRYFLLPVFAMLAIFVWMAVRGGRVARVTGGALLAASVAFGVVRDWREPPYKDYDFMRFVQYYRDAAPGERVQILYPPGWSMVLTKPRP